MSKKIFLSIICTTFLTQIPLSSSEMILGTEKITKDITVIFEGAPRDKIFSSPNNLHLSESETDVHIEALINWDEDIDIPSQVPGRWILLMVVSCLDLRIDYLYLNYSSISPYIVVDRVVDTRYSCL